MNQKINLDKLKKAGYRFSIVASIILQNRSVYCVILSQKLWFLFTG